MPNVAQRFMDCFPSLLRAFGLTNISRAKRRASDNKLEIPDEDKKFIAGTLTVALVEQHLAGTGRILGAVCLDDDGNVRWVCLDCDWYPVNHAQLEDEIERLRLPLLVCKSKSGGAHLYAFFTEPIPAELAIAKLEEWVALLIHLAPPGKKIEIFPKRPALNGGMGWYVNLPYYGGDKAENYGIRHGRRMPLEEFISRAAEMAKDRLYLESFTPRTAEKPTSPKDDKVKDFVQEKQKRQRRKKEEGDELEGGPPCIRIMRMMKVMEGTRDDAMIHVGVLMFKKYPNDFAERMLNFNREVMVPPLADNVVMNKARGLATKQYGYLCQREPQKSYCDKPLCKQQPFGVGNDANELLNTFRALKKYDRHPYPPTYDMNILDRWVVNLSGIEIRELRRLQLPIQSQLDIPNLPMVKPKVWLDHLATLMAHHMETIIVPKYLQMKERTMALLREYLSEPKDQEDALPKHPYANGSDTVDFDPGAFRTFAHKKDDLLDMKEFDLYLYQWVQAEYGPDFTEVDHVIKNRPIHTFRVPRPPAQTPSKPSIPEPPEAM